MTAKELLASARQGGRPPEGLSPVRRVLWLAMAGDWHQAHEECQKLPSPAGAWIHAYLHREEGDLSNAMYWYDRAGKNCPPPNVSLEAEWLDLAQELI